MNRQNIAQFNSSIRGKEAGRPGPYPQPQTGRPPQNFREGMVHRPMKPAGNSNMRTPMAVKVKPAQKPAVQVNKWKSSFKPVDGTEDDGDTDQMTDDQERVELYDPFDPSLSDNEGEMLRNQNYGRPLPDQDDNLEHQRLAPDVSHQKKSRWNKPYPELQSQPHDRHKYSEMRPAEGRGPNPGHRRSYSPDPESLDRTGYGSISRPMDQRGGSPDRFIHGSSAHHLPYGGQMTNEEEGRAMPEYRSERFTTVRLSPPRLPRDYAHRPGYVEKGRITPPPTERTRDKRKSAIMDKCPAMCDLCDIELSSGKELEDHLESKSHWDTLEFIQQQNNYDDLAIAFLQDVMLHKSLQCSRAIDDSALKALQENDHMAKVEMFHCAACQVFVSTSAFSVHSHITSEEHLSNTKEFEVHKRSGCPDRADAMMKELKPQFEQFLKGSSNPFE